MSKHTPEPWRVGKIKWVGNTQLIPICTNENKLIVHIHVPPDTEFEKSMANARLMVKSPKMYTVLKETKEAFHRQGTLRDCDIAKILDVLAEIEGEV